MRGTLKPQMSASSTPTVSPRDASAAARLTVTDDFPTPPLPLATAMTLVVDGTSVGAAFSTRVPPGALHRRGLLLGGHLAVLDDDGGDARQPAYLRLDVLLDLGPQRASGGGERDPDHDGAVGRDPDLVDHSELDDVGVELGVDDATQHAPDVFGRGRRPGHGCMDGGAGIVRIRDGERHGHLD